MRAESVLAPGLRIPCGAPVKARPSGQGASPLPPVCPVSLLPCGTGGTEGGREPLSAWASLTLSL